MLQENTVSGTMSQSLLRYRGKFVMDEETTRNHKHWDFPTGYGPDLRKEVCVYELTPRQSYVETYLQLLALTLQICGFRMGQARTVVVSSLASL
jgi:hypothetical protein